MDFGYHHDPTRVTRNTKDFVDLNLRLIDPWES
ncbi:type II toxin-antitoxin system VapC family toxin [Steroidobacter denitrificans]|nr:type II toxin-antitoxin system VapC family toxin [Steroidobacter denitrificans]